MRPFEESLEAERIRSEIDHGLAMSDQIETALNPPRASPGPMQHDVWRVFPTGEGGPAQLERVAQAVTVQARGTAGRREAVRKATEKLPEDEQYGTFVTVKHGEMSAPITREKKLEPTDVWS